MNRPYKKPNSKVSALEKYGDIIDLPHHQSSTRPHMELSARAAQFSPFAALTGYEDTLQEEAKNLHYSKTVSVAQPEAPDPEDLFNS